ncbi:MAG: MFS transporter [Prevotella sp.]|nr:MFS transporter [Candidatus Equicola stercoris]
MKPKLWNANYIKVLVANFLIYMSFMLLVPLLPLYMSETFGADKHTIGIVLAGYTLAALLIRPFSGFLVDTMPRKVVLLVSHFLFFAFFAGYLIAGSITLFAIVRTLHGTPFGTLSVAQNTAAIDVLDSSRRAEGIGYFGLSNNLGLALSPSLAIFMIQLTNSYDVLFCLSLLFSLMSLIINASIKMPVRNIVKEKPILSLDRFILLKGWSEGFCIICFSFAYGVLSTYLAIYGKEKLGITQGTGVFFSLVAIGLIISRLTGVANLRKGKILKNAAIGVVTSMIAYFLFATIHQSWAYYCSAFIIGLGNGHFYPAFQTMFINLAEHSQRGTANSTILTSWDLGLGLGILLGGIIAEATTYNTAFWMGAIVNSFGVLMFFFYVRSHFLHKRLR